MQIQKFGPVDEVFAMAELPVPRIGDDELLVEVHAVSMNPIDYKTITGAREVRSLSDIRFPMTVGIDWSGVVAEVGAEVRTFKRGDEVFGMTSETGGAFAELIATSVSRVAHKPKTIAHHEAASLPLVALTTWQSLVDTTRLGKGQKVFIPAGSGGIGTFAIQLAKELGATVATTTSTGNAGLVESLGADVVIDYKTQNFRDVLEGYDVVYDTLGGRTLEDSLHILKPGGIAVTIVGVPDPEFARARGMKWPLRALLYLMNTKIRGLCNRLGLRYSFVLAKALGSELAEVAALVEKQKIKPIVDRVFSFEQTKDAMLYLQTGRAKGKVVAKLK
jgi:NADPH:quinone reductase-like Zn-dependent oxidoreductase